MSVYALSEELWGYSQESDRSFRRWVLIVAVPFLIIGLVLPFLQLAGLERGGGDLGTQRFAQLIQDEAPRAEEIEEAAPADEPEPVVEPEEPAPEPEVVETPPEPTAVAEPTPEPPRETARETVRREYAQAFAALDELRDPNLTAPSQDTLRSSSEVLSASGSGRTGASAIESSARQQSAGAGSGDVRRQQAGTGLGQRTTTTVDRPAGIGEPRERIGQGGDRTRAGRTLEEIQLIFDRNKGAFYTLYNRALRDNPSLRGKITLRLTIAPNGSVTAAEIVDSELNNPDLEQRVLTRVRTLNFGAKPDVDSITLNYPMYFMPT
jgi:protein TonB